MKLHQQNDVFWLTSSFAEKDTAKQAGFLWHGGSCVLGCSACKAGIGRVWWTKHAHIAEKLVTVADDDVKALFDKTKQQVAESRASDVEDVDAFRKRVPAPAGLDYMPFQRAGIKFMLEHPYCMLGDDMGLGKGLCYGTPMLTPTGWRPIETLRIGDFVCDPDTGGPARVTGVYPQQRQDIYRVTFSDGVFVEVDSAHRWLVQTAVQRYTNRPGRVMSTQDLLSAGVRTKRDRRGWTNRRWFIPVTAPIAFTELAEPRPVHPYVLGVLLGDGSFVQHSVTVSNPDVEIYERVSRYCVAGKPRNKKNRCVTFTVHGVLPAIRQLGLEQHLSPQKFIPTQYLRAPIAERLELLRGLMDTDGDCSKGGTAIFNTSSPRLRDDVVDLVRALGGIATVSTKPTPQYSYRGERRIGLPAYRVNVRLPENPFHLKKKAERWKPPILARAIDSILHIGKAETICIAVNSTRNLYVTDHYIVTHNTPQSLGVLNAMPEVRAALVIVPPTLRINWRREAARWLTDPAWDVVIVEHPEEVPAANDKRQLVIVPDTRIGGDKNEAMRQQLMIREWDVLIADECHRMKHANSQRARGLFGSFGKRGQLEEPGLVQRAKRLMMLSGTLITNRPLELFPILRAVDPTGLGANFFRYAKRYCDAKQVSAGYNKVKWDFSGASNLEELQHRLRGDGLMIRRRKLDVLKELPPKRRQVIALPQNGSRDAVKAENEAFKRYQAELEAATTAAETAEILEDDDAFKDAAGALQDVRRRMATEMAQERHRVALAKVGAVVEHVLAALDDPQQKLVLFVHHKKVVAKLEEAFAEAKIKTVTLTGSTPNDKRQEAVDAFQNDPTVRVFIGNIIAAGVGITLTAADLVIFAELDWTPGNCLQAEDRCIVSGSKLYYPRMGVADIDTVRVGDEVLTASGRLGKVTAVHKRVHRGALTTIHYMRWFEPLKCTHDHKILVRPKHENKLVWLEAHKVLPGDFLVMPRRGGGAPLETIEFALSWRAADYAIDPDATTCQIAGCTEPKVARGRCSIHYRRWMRKTNPAERPRRKQRNSRYIPMPEQIRVDDMLLYLFGWYVAEGFASTAGGKGRFISLSGHQKERPILERLGRYMQHEWGVTFTIYTNKKTKGIELRAYSLELANWFMDWFGHTAHNKRLPPVLMDLPADQAKTLLRAYIDGDGHRRNRQHSWTSVSSTLCYQMCMLAARCGYSPTMERHPRPGYTDKYVGGYTEHGEPSNPALNYADDDFIYQPVRSVETSYARRTRVFDLTVEPDHSFVVGFAAVHNCVRIGQTRSVLVQYLVFDGSIDARMANMLAEKMEVIEAALDREGGVKPIDIPATPEEKPRPPRKTYPVPSEEHRKLAAAAVQRLAAMCDGANRLDGAGFNRLDTRFGHQLAARAMIRQLTDGEVFAAKKLARKYHRQLDEETFATLWAADVALGTDVIDTYIL